MRNWILTITLLLFILPSLADAAATNRFKNLAAYDDKGGLKLVFTFEGRVKPRLKMLERVAQIEVKSAYVSPSKRRFELDKQGLAEVRVYQMDKDTLRIRLLPTDLKNGMASMASRFTLSTDANRIVIKLLPVTVPATAIGKAAATPQEDIKNDHITQNIASLKPVSATKEAVSNIPSASKNVKKLTTGFLSGDGFVGQAEAASKAEASTSAEAASSAAEENLGFLNYKEPTLPEVPSIGNSIMKVMSALAIVLGTVLLVGKFAKKHFASIDGKLGGRKDISILSTHHIGVKKQITLIEVGGEVLLLGVTNSSINLLNSYTDPEKIEKIKLGARLPKKSTGTALRMPGLSWGVSAKERISQKFAKEVDAAKGKMNDEKLAEVSAMQEAAANTKLAEQVERKLASDGRKAEKSKLISQMARELAAKVQKAQAAEAMG